MIEVGEEWVLHTSGFRLKEQTAPTVIPDNTLHLYAKDNGSGVSILCYKNDAEVEICLGASTSASTVDTDGSGTANEVAIFSDINTIIGDAGFTFDPSTNIAVLTGGLTISAFTAGSVIFSGAAGALSQDNSNFFWDDANNRLGLGTAVPAVTLDFLGAMRQRATGGQTYEFSRRAGDFLTLQGLTTGSSNRFELYTNDGDGTDPLSYTIFAKGTPGAVTNFEQLRLEYDNTGPIFKLLTNAGGTGTVRALTLQTGTNTDQLQLQTDGDVSMGVSGADFYLNAGTVYGGIASGGVLTLESTSHATKGDITTVAADITHLSTSRFRMASQNRFRYLNTGAKAYNNANQSITTGTVTAINLQVEDFDTDGLHDNVTNNTRLTVQLTGIYEIHANILWDTNATGGRHCIIRKNGVATDLLVSSIPGNGAFSPNSHISGFIQLTAGDYIEMFGFQDSGGNLNALAIGQQTHLSAIYGGE
jgi:hypothetical protein